MRGLVLTLISVWVMILSPSFSQAQEQNASEIQVQGTEEDKEEKKAFDPGSKAISHISDANAFHLFTDYYFHLPVILYAPDFGWTTMLTTRKFQPVSGGNGSLAIDRYVLYHGLIHRVRDNSFPTEEVEIDGFEYKKVTDEEGEESEVLNVLYQGQAYDLDKKSTVDGGLFGGKITSYYDFSITKNVFSMLLVFFLLVYVFLSVAKAYKKRDGMAPKGLQAFMEPIILFIQDDVAKPFLGDKYLRFMPFLLSLFFFILGLNLLGQVPFFPGSANVTGNIAVTAVLALFTFFTVNIMGNRHYWQHILWMPGVPGLVKLIILTPVEIIGMFIKPLTLMLRLFASITAGHIVIIAFVSLIFIFGNAGESILGSGIGALVAIPLTMFMFAIELIIALVQAFVFTILTASYLGAATEEHH